MRQFHGRIDISGNDRVNILDEARRVLKIEAEALKELAKNLDESFVRAVDVLHGSSGRVIVTGMGKSGLVGKKVAATFASTGTPAYSMHPAEAAHGDLGMVTERDVVIAISNSGETAEVVALIPYLKRFGVKLISITGNKKSTLARASDANIDISVKKEACPMGIVPTASTTAALAMGDALAIALLVKKGFKEEDFAAIHPNGALGKKLLTKVKDLMHEGNALPIVLSGSPMTDAVIEMSSKRLGITTVVDKHGKLKGVITDGDLRRGLQKWGGRLFEMKADEVMIADPKTIGAEELAAKALSVMEKHSITALLVLDKNKRPEGIIHLHDILREGIV